MKNNRLKNIQNIIELVIFIYLLIKLFPSSTNIIIFSIKFCIYLVMSITLLFIISSLLDELRLYIEKNFIKWLRKQYETKQDFKKGIYTNNIISNILIFLVNILIERERVTTQTLYFIRHNKIETFIIFIFILLFLCVFYILLL